MRYTLGNKSFRNILFAVIVLLGVALSIIVSALSYYDDKKHIQIEFNEAAENQYSVLKRELDSDLSVLASFQALYHSSKKDIERSEFKSFTSHILKQHSSIQAVNWIPRVPDSRRASYERAARREGFPDFQLTEHTAQEKMKRAENRKEYFPVYFVEPDKGNKIALGFDLASTPDRRETMEVARKTGKMRATARITLVQETKSQFGFMVFAPIYRKLALINSDRARWDNLEGFALGTFRISDIAEEAMNYLKPEGVDFFIYDTSAPEKNLFLYTHSSRARKTPLLNQDRPVTGFIISKALEVAGRKWLVIYSATPDFIAARSNWHPRGFLLMGLALTGLVVVLLRISISHAEHAEKSAKDLSDLNKNLAQEIMDRKQAQEALIDIIDFFPDPTFVIDNDKKVIIWNVAIEKMTRVRKAEIIGKGDYAYTVPFYGEKRKQMLDFLDGDDTDLAARYKDIQEKGNVLYAETFCPGLYGGRGAYVWATAAPLFNEKGIRVGAIETIRDITEQVKAKEALHKAYTEVEMRVQERTMELSYLNDQLKTEIEIRKRTEDELRMAHAQLEQRVFERTLELNRSNEQLRNLAAHLQSVREEERMKIAREIHDELGQTLSAQKMELSWFREKYGDHKPILDKAGAMLESLNNTIRSVRRICSELRPSILDDFGLVEAIKWQADEFQKRTGIECAIDSEPEVIELDRERSTVLFRIFQEALTNVLKHAKATKVTSRLTKDSNNITLEVIDNGKGITVEQLSKSQSYGLMGMRERVYPLGGKVEILGDKSRGTTVRVSMPYMG